MFVWGKKSLWLWSNIIQRTSDTHNSWTLTFINATEHRLLGEKEKVIGVLHSEMFLGSIPGQGLTVWSLHVHPVFVWVPSGYSVLSKMDEWIDL